MSCLRVIILAVLLSGTTALAQTLDYGIKGENPGDRSGSTVTTGHVKTFGLFGACGISTRTVAAAPGWSSYTGRVEIWSLPAWNDPAGHVSHSLTGAAPGDEFGFSLVAGANVDFGPNGYVVGAPGANGDTGYVEATVIPPCPSSALWSHKWTANGTSTGERFGHAMANLGDVDGDGHDDILVSAPKRDRTLIFGGFRQDAGAVYVLSGATGGVIRSHFGSTSYGHMGWSVAVIGDLDGDGAPDYAIGEPGFNALGPGGVSWNGAGRVRVYSGAAGTSIGGAWSEGPGDGAQHGWALGSAGDANQDGTPDYLAGSPYHDVGSTFVIIDAGHAEVISGVNGSVIFQMNGPSAHARLGASVAGGHDLLSNGYPEIVIGAPGYSSSRGRARVVSMRTHDIVYDVTGNLGEELGFFVSMGSGEWTVGTPGRSSSRGGWRVYEGVVDWRIEGTFPTYGSSLAVLDDVDGDGWDDFAVGQYDPTGSYAVPVWDVRSGRTSEVLYPFSQSALYGHTLGRLGDVNGDGVADLAHGKPFENVIAIRSGSNPNTIIRTHTIPGEIPGHVMTDAGDVNGDGTADYLICDPLADSPGPAVNVDAGRVQVYSGLTGAFIREHWGTHMGSGLGWSATALGDVDGDGYDDYGAGAPFHDVLSTTDAGRAFVYSGLDGSVIWTDPGYAFLGNFGRGIAGPGDVDGDGLADFAVGEPGWGASGASGEGRVRIFKGGPSYSSFPVIHELVGPYDGANAGWAVTAMGDVDRDGVEDIGYSCPRLGFTAGASVHISSGATGDQIFYRNANGYWPHGGSYGLTLAGKRGAHADFRQEMLVGVPSDTTNGGVEMIFHPTGAGIDLGGGCGSGGPNQPTLSFGPGVIGQYSVLSLTDMPPTAAMPQVAMSPPSPPLFLGFGCVVHVNPNNYLVITALANNTSVSIYIPEIPALAGFESHLQAFAFDSGAPLLISLSNGLLVRLGH